MFRIISKCLSGTGAELALADIAVMEAGKATMFSGSLEIMKYMFVGVQRVRKGERRPLWEQPCWGVHGESLKKGFFFFFYWGLTYIP